MVSPASATRRSLPEEVAVSKGIPPDYEKFTKAIHLVRLPEDSVLYQLRHSGASLDLLHHHRARWVTETSVRRYAKHGRFQRLLAELPLASRACCETSSQKIEDVVQGRLLARTLA
jgi:hypothetical protein